MDVASLFKDDNVVEITSSRSHHSWWDSSSEALQPLTSDSEGIFDNPCDSGEEEVDNDGDFHQHVSMSSCVPIGQNLAG